jgi:hypothetical protein
MPKGDSIDYLLSVPPEKSDLTDIIVFCIDTSGSMCCTSEVTGEIKVKENAQLSQSLDQFIERENGVVAQQFLPNERRNATYVSRLQCVQAAVLAQIEQLVKEHPNKRVVIVSFSNDVTLYLPGGVKHVIAGDKLNDYDHLISAGTQLGINVEKSIANTQEELIKIVLGLEESGATALGPALLTSISIAGSARGSSVLLCTDGLANVGLGTLENQILADDNSPTAQFYQRVSNDALGRGVAVSVLSIQGSNTSLEYIAKVSADTRGVNHIVNPLNLTKNFNFILQNTIIATDVTATMFLNKAFTFRHEKNVQDSRAIREIGNVTQESAITFEYCPKNKEELKGVKEVCFQVQIKFTKLDGSKCVRILSKKIEITHDRLQAEKHVNVNIVGLHSQAQAAQKAAEGKYTAARMIQKRNMRMVRRALATEDAKEEQQAHYELWNDEAVRFNDAIKATKIKEKKDGIRYDSAAEDEGSGSDSAPEEKKEKVSETVTETVTETETESEVQQFKQEKMVRKEQRRQERKQRRAMNDEVSNVLYQAQNPLYSAFTYNENPLWKKD